jgi:UTP--glucose-1-phosphate uridylyltransferase
MTKVRKAVIPAAGLGTRFLPATKAQPKEMLPLLDKPAIQYVVEEAVRAGLTDIIIIIGRGKHAIVDHFDRSFELEHFLEAKGKFEELKEVREISDMASIHYIRQRDPLGLGHAVAAAEGHVGDEPFAVLLGDDVIDEGEKLLAELVATYERHGASVVAAMEVEPAQIKAYGAVTPAEEVQPGLHRMADIVEKPAPEEAPSNLAVIGRYVLHPEVFDALRVTEPGAGGEIQLSDALKHLVHNSERGVLAYTFSGIRYDAGDKNDYLRATVELAARRDDIGPAFVAFLRRFLADLDAGPPRR